MKIYITASKFYSMEYDAQFYEGINHVREI